MQYVCTSVSNPKGISANTGPLVAAMNKHLTDAAEQGWQLFSTMIPPGQGHINEVWFIWQRP